MSTGPLLPPALPGRIQRVRVPADGAAHPALAAAVIGPRDGPVWLLGHGAGSSARFVAEAFAPALVAAGRQLVVADMRGHGASAPARDPGHFALAPLAADLARTLDALRAADVVAGVEPEVVGGVSLGAHSAAAALGTGRLHAGHLLGILPAAIGSVPPGEGPHAAIAQRVATIGIEAALDELRRAPGLRPWLRRSVLTDQARHDPASLLAALGALDGMQAPDATTLAALAVPTTVFGWPDDPGHPLEVARAWAQATRGQLIEGRLDALDAGPGAGDARAAGVGALGATLVPAVLTSSPHGTVSSRGVSPPG
ncbi:MAG: alpha/beta fold hydrolase [Nitriliruptoraceae bacterium]|nr:alpha/beta fold hydrolase [Nitriliruptoraceae bacterium]